MHRNNIKPCSYLVKWDVQGESLLGETKAAHFDYEVMQESFVNRTVSCFSMSFTVWKFQKHNGISCHVLQHVSVKEGSS